MLASAKLAALRVRHDVCVSFCKLLDELVQERRLMENMVLRGLGLRWLTEYQRGSIFGAILVGVAFAAAFSTIPRSNNQVPYEQSAGKLDSNVAKHPTEESWAEWATADPVAAFTLALVLVAAVQAGLFIWQLGYMRISLQDAKGASESARDSAKALQAGTVISKLSMISGERAYVHFNGCRWISHPDHSGRIFWRIRPTWFNSGNTPTRNLRIYVHYELLDKPLGAEYKFIQLNSPRKPVTLYPKSGIESQPRDVYGGDLLDVKDGKKYLYVWGVARYNDVFPDTAEHMTKFCVVATNLSGDPLRSWHATDNNFDIAFAGFDKHNCADEECDN